MCEYSEVEEDDGEFREADESFVDNLASVPELQILLAEIVGNLAVGSYHYCFPKIEWGQVDSMVSKSIMYSCSRCQILFSWIYDNCRLTGKA